jgi:hypothetical protein
MWKLTLGYGIGDALIPKPNWYQSSKKFDYQTFTGMTFYFILYVAITSFSSVGFPKPET